MTKDGSDVWGGGAAEGDKQAVPAESLYSGGQLRKHTGCVVVLVEAERQRKEKRNVAMEVERERRRIEHLGDEADVTRPHSSKPESVSACPQVGLSLS